MFVAQEDEIIAWLYDCEMLQATPLITFVLAKHPGNRLPTSLSRMFVDIDTVIPESGGLYRGKL
jgi:hypothetical protein